MTDEAGKKVEQSLRSPPKSPDAPQAEAAGDQVAGLSESNFLPRHDVDVPLESLSLRKRHSEEIRKLERVWNDRLKEYEEQNKYLWYSTTKKLSDDLTKIEQKYTHKRRYDPLCPEVEDKLEACYQHNKSSSLKCSQQVRDFASCVQDARFRALQSRT